MRKLKKNKSQTLKSILNEMKEVKTDKCFVCGLTVYWSNHKWNHYTGQNVGHNVVIKR